MDFVSRDCISGLPDSLISHILSFLTTKEAASTSVLSKKWRHLFAFGTNLDFDDDESSPSFMQFVDRVLALQGNGMVKKFSLKCDGNADPDRVTGWILNVLKRGVSDFSLSLPKYHFPSEIFVSKTLVRLKLGPSDDFTLRIGVGKFCLPKLKTLCIDLVLIKEDNVGLAKLLSGCLVLEELVLMNPPGEYENWEFCSVSITTLKRLKFYCEDTALNPMSVSFDTLNLVYLEYSDALADKYPKVNFHSLVEAHICLRLTDDQSAEAKSSEDGYFSEGEDEKKMVGDATSFLVGICNVQTLYLSVQALEVLTYYCEATPVFNKLIQLMIESNSKTGWDSLPKIPNNCPNLDTLVLKRLVHKYNNACGNICCCKRRKGPSCLSSSPVKVLKIFMFKDYNEDMNETEQIKHFLNNMPRLEQLIVYYDTSYDPAVFELSNKLQNIHTTASPKCKIDVISRKLSLSSTVPSSLTRKWFTSTDISRSSPSPDEDDDDDMEDDFGGHEYYHDFDEYEDDDEDDMYF